MKVSETNRPSPAFVAAVQAAYVHATVDSNRVTCAAMWDHICAACIRETPGAFTRLFEWDRTKPGTRVNRIGTIAECIAGGYVPGLRLGKGLTVERVY